MIELFIILETVNIQTVLHKLHKTADLFFLMIFIINIVIIFIMAKLKNDIYQLDANGVSTVGQFYIICEVVKTFIGLWIYIVLLHWQYDKDNYNAEEKKLAKTVIHFNFIVLGPLAVFVVQCNRVAKIIGSKIKPAPP